MTIKLGGQTLAIRRPADLDAALIASTGCNAAELAAQLTNGGTAFHVARAALPFVDQTDVGALATTISDDELVDARRQVIDLLAPPAPTPAKQDKAA